MPPAFGRFDEPHAWLLRSLVEYGWTDSSRTQGWVPPGAIGGVNLQRILGNDGRDGFTLDVPAVSEGRPCAEDGTYTFTVQVSTGNSGLIAVVRCPEANFFQEFAYDRKNPSWTGGYIHQALTEYVPQFVAWRLGGNEVPWAQRVGIPTVKGEPASAPLINFLRDRLMANKPLQQGLSEGWWLDGPAGPPVPKMGPAPVPAAAWSGPIATLGKGGGDPTYMSAAAREAATRNALSGAQMVSPREEASLQAKARLSAPGIGLFIMSGLNLLFGFAWLANALSIITTYQGNTAAMIFSLVLGGSIVLASLPAFFGAAQYRRFGGRFLPWYAMAYVACVPGCCFVGLPVAIWAGRAWMDPMVKGAREAGPALPSPPAAD